MFDDGGVSIVCVFANIHSYGARMSAVLTVSGIPDFLLILVNIILSIMLVKSSVSIVVFHWYLAMAIGIDFIILVIVLTDCMNFILLMAVLILSSVIFCI